MFDKVDMAKKYSEKYHASYNALPQKKKDIITMIKSGAWVPRPDREWYNDWVKKIIQDAEYSYEEDQSGKLKKIKLK